MRRNIQFATIAACWLLFSCNKDSVEENGNLLTGKWSIITDTTYSGVGAGNHPVSYTGKPDDYLDFNTNGILYIMESGRLNSLSYTSVSDNIVVINSFLSDGSGYGDTCSVTDLTMHNAVISTIILASPGGTLGRKVHLSK